MFCHQTLVRKSSGEIRSTYISKREIFSTITITLEVREEVLVLTSRLQKKDLPGKFYKSSVDNKSYFSKEEIFLITNRQEIDEKYFCWLKSSRTDKKSKYRLQREEILAL